MRNIINAALIVILGSSTAFAAGVGQTEGLSNLAIAFLVFGGMILVFQLIPALALFFSMLKGLFSASERKAPETARVGEEK